MRNSWWCLLGVAGVLAGEPRGGLETKVDDGRMTTVSAWWQPRPDWEGRWWWHPDTGGSAWFKADGIQLGPLVVSSGAEGLRSWGPNSRLVSGYWGCGWQGESWGTWLVQSPEHLEAGVQTQVRMGPWLGGIGADRAWSLEAPDPATSPWVDRARAGLSWRQDQWSGGAEASGRWPAGQDGSGRYRARVSWSPGVWAVDFKTAGFPWSAETRVAWMGWFLNWKGDSQDSSAVWSGGWKGRGRWSAYDWALEAETRWTQGRWNDRGAVSLGGSGDQTQWSVGWSFTTDHSQWSQAVTAKWKESHLEAEARWMADGFSLGWFGAGARCDLVLRWLL